VINNSREAMVKAKSVVVSGRNVMITDFYSNHMALANTPRGETARSRGEPLSKLQCERHAGVDEDVSNL
jgi:hypothetical protein